MRSHSAKRIPRNSKPIKISQEPGVKGVISAKNPKIINSVPAALLTREFLSDIFLNRVFQSAIV